MFERFTDRARRVVVLAQDEAKALNHNYIGTEHLLLGLISEGEGVAAKALESLDISLELSAPGGGDYWPRHLNADGPHSLYPACQEGS
ncbi:ATP-dependent Clp protease [Cutibacterium acnes JCM 18920]|nr:ATP-dependent Clp protease [Cutibacterium acnes JCM 18920]